MPRYLNVSKRTLQYWISKYQQFGLIGLVRKSRADSGVFKVEKEVQEEIKNLILSHKRNSVTSIHRKICEICKKNNWKQPTYYQVYAISKSLSPGLKKLAHEGKKEYQNTYDIIHRREASYPNEIWQADHTPLDIIVLNEKGKPERPWLTIILDDYSRAVAGYFLSFQDPSAIQTSLVLHQAIWRKSNPDWQICGIPEKFYTDHGSDFTSNHLEQVAIDLKINLVFSTVGVPRGRGKIEKFFSTINQLFLQDLPGYIYDRNDLAMILIGMPGIEKRLTRYPQLYSRIGFAHEFDKLSKDETHHILEYKWEELGLSIKLEDFSDYEAITSIIKITGGNFRLIQRLFTQIERILEINNLETITTEVVEAARDSLVIGIK